MLFDSLQHKRLTLPDHLELFPGHQAGRIFDTSLSGKPSSTLGFEKRFNPLLALKDREQLIRQITGMLPLTEVRSVLFGRALVSVGFAVGGGILAECPASAAAHVAAERAGGEHLSYGGEHLSSGGDLAAA